MYDDGVLTPVAPAGRSAASWSWRSPLVFAVLMAACVVTVVAVLGYGNRAFGGGHAAGAAGGPPAGPDPYPKLLLALPVILATCHVLGRVFERFGQPRVVGEIAAGIVMGPSLFGLFWPSVHGWVFPPQVTSSLGVLAQLGLVLFMFLVGRELDLGSLRRCGYTAAAVSQAGIVVPFLAGLLLALVMYRPFAPDGIGFPAFALFLAVSMSITAFPVLARILADLSLSGTALGAAALSCAAVDDVMAWCLLAVVVATVEGTSFAGVGITVLLSAGFVLLMLLAVRPLLARAVTADEHGRVRIPEPAVLPVLLCGIMLSSLATDQIGIHPIFGAFLFGAVTPRESARVEQATAKMRDITVTLLLPLFFVYLGLRTKFALLGGEAELWLWCLAVVGVAIAGKWGGSTAAARATGFGWRDSLSLGALMNCRGLTELIVLNVGLDLGVITPTMFAMLVVMALVSTMLTTPALSLIGRAGDSWARARLRGAPAAP